MANEEKDDMKLIFIFIIVFFSIKWSNYRKSLFYCGVSCLLFYLYDKNKKIYIQFTVVQEVFDKLVNSVQIFQSLFTSFMSVLVLSVQIFIVCI